MSSVPDLKAKFKRVYIHLTWAGPRQVNRCKASATVGKWVVGTSGKLSSRRLLVREAFSSGYEVCLSK